MMEAQHGPLDPELREMYAQVDLGLAVAAFLKTTVGKYIMRRAEEDRIDALADLVDANAADSERIRELQLIVKRADSLQGWLEEAIAQGRNAEAQLNPVNQPAHEEDEP